MTIPEQLTEIERKLGILFGLITFIAAGISILTFAYLVGWVK